MVSDLEPNDVADHHVVHRHLLPPAAPDDVDSDVVGELRELAKLRVLPEITDGRDGDDEEDGEEDAPAVVPALADPLLLDAEGERQSSTNQQDEYRGVLEAFHHETEEASRRWLRVSIGTEHVSPALVLLLLVVVQIKNGEGWFGFGFGFLEVRNEGSRRKDGEKSRVPSFAGFIKVSGGIKECLNSLQIGHQRHRHIKRELNLK
ncbi:Calcium-transporting ATPase 12, plasma membrane-type [Senna tora]|uniref:Calcium-transporting ATPase 12, plasma membrane-type n=1 Tax=Senna tora TaxID=362788 RepID=A0A834SM61_9FABA|nr:Calcium-transporting ATPase 12, plasma membrane-type [Senna tora]